jgi:hypothetical protein
MRAGPAAFSVVGVVLFGLRVCLGVAVCVVVVALGVRLCRCVAGVTIGAICAVDSSVGSTVRLGVGGGAGVLSARVMAATATPRLTARTRATIAITGDTAGPGSWSSSTTRNTSSWLGSTACARAEMRSRSDSRASSSSAMIGRPAASRRPFASASRTSSHGGQLLTWRRSGAARGVSRVPSASVLRVTRSTVVRPA